MVRQQVVSKRDVADAPPERFGIHHKFPEVHKKSEILWGDLQSQLAAARPVPEPVVRFLRMLPPGDTMDLLRTLTSALGHYDPDASDGTPQANYRKAIRLTAQLSSLVAAMGRIGAGNGLIQPDPVLGHAANFLYMLTGERPSGLATRAFDVALILHADHELNASTFATRVTISTGASLSAGVLAGLATLTGPLHGGAASSVRALIDLANDIGPEAAVRHWLAQGRAFPAFGHPLYADGDPRASALLSVLSVPPLYGELATCVERTVGERPNVDFALAVLAAVFDLPAYAPLSLFALGRCAGWLAHALEQAQTGHLIRPRARYVGLQPESSQ